MSQILIWGILKNRYGFYVNIINKLRVNVPRKFINANCNCTLDINLLGLIFLEFFLVTRFVFMTIKSS